MLRRASGGPSGPVDIDTIMPADSYSQNLTPIRAIADSYDPTMRYIAYYNGWANVTNAAAYRGTLTMTSDPNAFFLARAFGDTISIYRSTAAANGSMDIYVDGIFHGTVSNTTSNGVSVPYTIAGLSPTDHTIEVGNNASSTIALDKIAVSTMRPMAFNRLTDDRVTASYGFTGLWTPVSDISAYNRTLMRTTDTSARVAFRFTGNWVCVGYTLQPGGASMDLYLDDVYQGTINSSSVGTYYQSSWCSTLFADQTHFVELVYAGGGVFDLDFVNPRQYRTITFDRKVVQESDASITRNNPSNWFTSGIVASAGGFRPNGGRQIWSNTVGSSLDFWINGTGFILYTSVGPEMGDWEVYVDGVLFTTIDLYSWRWRPMAYGITNLGPGFHNIDLVAINTSPGYNVYFDGVRAFP
ncbi:MAG: hypothetical protein H6671_10820 [Anaerolineaceae bacterium]|nr:hypothetical protein [Anaerolineaceae bacterium]